MRASKHQRTNYFSMRTTPTHDKDVAVALERLRNSHDASVNDLLRRGLRDANARPKQDSRFAYRRPILVLR